jgi:cell wall-associated NlpC family hydrolase
MFTRQQVADKALSMRGVRFLHQGRSREGVDCMGLLYVILTELGYKGIIDVEGYNRTPSAQLIYDTMKANFDEIPVEDVGLGDIFLMRIGGAKPKHASILVRNERDIERGIEPEIVHASAIAGKGRVVVDALENWRPWCVRGFRLRGLVD